MQVNGYRAGTLVLTAAVVMLGATAVPGAETASKFLRLRPRAGETFERLLTWNQRLVLGGDVLGQEMRRSLRLRLGIRVVSLEPSGAATVEIACRSLVFRQDDPLGTVTYDSEHPPQQIPAMVRDLAPIAGSSLTLGVSGEGRLIPLREADKALVEALAVLYPSWPVGPGDGWAARTVFSGSYSAVLETNLTLKEKREGAVLIEAASTLTPGPRGGAAGAPRLLVFGEDLAGSQRGTVELDDVTGWPRRARFRQTFTGSVRLGFGTGFLGDLAAPVSGEGDLILEPLTGE